MVCDYQTVEIDFLGHSSARHEIRRLQGVGLSHKRLAAEVLFFASTCAGHESRAGTIPEIRRLTGNPLSYRRCYTSVHQDILNLHGIPTSSG